MNSASAEVFASVENVRAPLCGVPVLRVLKPDQWFPTKLRNFCAICIKFAALFAKKIVFRWISDVCRAGCCGQGDTLLAIRSLETLGAGRRWLNLWAIEFSPIRCIKILVA